MHRRAVECCRLGLPASAKDGLLLLACGPYVRVFAKYLRCQKAWLRELNAVLKMREGERKGAQERMTTENEEEK